MWLRLLKGCRIGGRAHTAGEHVRVTVDEAAELLGLHLAVVVFSDPRAIIAELENKIRVGKVRGALLVSTKEQIRLLRKHLLEIEQPSDEFMPAE